MRLVALLMAAGSARRAGGCNKLLARDAAGQCMIARSLAAVLCSQADEIVVVLGHQRAAIEAALQGAHRAGAGLLASPRLHLTGAARHAEGLSASLHAGLSGALLLQADAVMVCLGDMPLVRPRTMNRLIERLRADPKAFACVPVMDGRRGNPVLWRSGLFASLMALSGDRGGRDLLDRHATRVIEVAVDDAGIVRDFDTPERLAAFAMEPAAPADEPAHCKTKDQETAP